MPTITGTGQTNCGNDFTDDGITVQILAQDMPPQAIHRPCRDEECKAKQEIGCAIDAITHRLHPNFMTYTSEAFALRAHRQYATNILALGKQHPTRIPLYCTLVTKVAAAMTGDPAHDKRTFQNITELALLLDRPRRTCLDQVAQALPKDPATQADLRELTTCLAQRPCHRRLLAATIADP